MNALIAQSVSTDPWRWQLHIEVWLLMAFLIGSYTYALRAIGPHVVAPGAPVVSRRQLTWFVGAMLVLFIGSDWPMHDIAEEYLYSVHMVQHMLITYFLPPMVLLATPEWLLRTIVGDGRAYSVVRWLSKPVIAGVMFNAIVMISHIPGVVNQSVSNGLLHYAVHLVLVTTALFMWMPVIGPFRELQIGPGAKMIYLFLMSVVPTVPAAWLTFAEGVVYDHYDIGVRVWGLSATEDQQIAGAIMKLGGSIFLWTVVFVMFVRYFNRPFRDANANTYRRSTQIPTAEIIGHDERPLTFDDVEAAFQQSRPLPEPEHR
jgi:putative membrane protein